MDRKSNPGISFSGKPGLCSASLPGPFPQCPASRMSKDIRTRIMCFLVGSIILLMSFVIFIYLKRRKSKGGISFLGASTSRHTKMEIEENPECSPTSVEESGHEYEVFLSFMGNDTRKGFTDHLYHRMLDAGICVFKDNVNLPEGEEIAGSLSEAIKKSKISVPILSTNYAASKWCLDELVLMLECRETRKQMVLPIFYDVTPSQVKKQNKSYATAFSEHDKNYDVQTVEKWRKALAEVASLKGLELEKETYGHEAQLTKLIVAKVLSVLKKTHLLVPDSLVGIDNQANKIMDLLRLGANDVRIVGIWGMGGIGKTTLAKYVYNQILDGFECCSFLKDIRETSLQHKGIEGLQSQLYSNLSMLAHGKNFTSIDEGTSELKYRFREKKVLILLDDVDQIHQLNALAAEVGWFGAGSRIIVTTRISAVLDVHQVSDVYEVEEMDQGVAVRLFRRHAFRKDSPNDEFKAVMYDVVKTTGGLPLALEVIGSSLYLKRKSIWEETLRKLKRAPKEEVQKRLQISYDMLDDDQKQMFLDVACLFIGEDIDVVMHVWKDRNFSAETGTDVLLASSLIKIGEDNRIWMHDQLKDLGREIVRKENYKQPGMRSRLWCVDEARDALEKLVISSDTEALHLRFDSRRDNQIMNEQLRNFPNIWYLHLYYADFIGDFHHLLTNLRWLTWRCSSSKCCATNINLEKLLVLDLSYSWNIRDDWELWSSIQSAKKLRVLNLTSCMRLSTLDVSMLISLEKLILDNCFQLKEISVGKLEGLLTLSMNDCHCITELPISSLANLERLLLANCRSIKRLPDSVGKLKSLIELDLSGTLFPDLPSSICDLENLQVLKIVDSRICSLPNAIVESEKLHIIDNFAYKYLKGNKEQLALGVSTYIKMIKSLKGSKVLRELKFSGDGNYEHRKTHQALQRLIGVEALQFLHVLLCGSIEKLLIPSNLKFLVRLDFHCCEKLQQIEGLDDLEVLEELNITGCCEIMKIPSLSKLNSLKILNCSNCLRLEELEGVDGLKALEELNLKGCRSIMKLPSVSKLGSLKRLNCCGCMKLQEIEGLDDLEALEELNITGCGGIMKIPSLSKLKSLKILNCSKCLRLKELEGVDGLKALEELNLEICRAIEKLPSLSKLRSLKKLNCWYCEKLQEIEGLDDLEALEELNITGCREIMKIPSLSKLKSLKILNCSYCLKLEELEGVDGLKALEEFNLERCRAIENLSSLSKLRSLKKLNCCGCMKLQQIEGLDDLEALEEFNLQRCRAIEKLPTLSKLRSLKTLNCCDCEKLQEIVGLDGLEALEDVDISGCKAIRHIPVLPRQMKFKRQWLDLRGCNSYEKVHGNRELRRFCCICQLSAENLHCIVDGSIDYEFEDENLSFIGDFLTTGDDYGLSISPSPFEDERAPWAWDN